MPAVKSLYIVDKKIADLPYYTEGPAVDSQGNIFCTTLTAGKILKIDKHGEMTDWAESLCPNGQIILSDGDHLVCDSQLRRILRFASDGTFLRNEVDGFCDGQPVYQPNDLVADTKGNLYYTDSVRHKGKVCFLGTDKSQRIIANGLDYPNGLVLSIDGRKLYVAESYQNRILQIDLRYPGETAGHICKFTDLPGSGSGKPEDNLPDGLAIDNDGNVWVAHYGTHSILQFSQEAVISFQLETEIKCVSNLVFADSETIIVTGGYGEPGPGALFKFQFLRAK
jgi:gluconolactonase